MLAKRPKGNFEAVGELLGPIMKRLGLGAQLEEYRAVEEWDEVVGRPVAENARATGIDKGVLYVDVSSSVWIQELSLLREKIIERMNDHLEANVVRKIVLSLEREHRTR